MSALEEYGRKRDFSRTPEPAPSAGAAEARPSLFVVQKHHARRLHFDFRLELEGVLKSWAVPKGFSDDPADKRLAIRTEDHPLSYARFSGTIPEGEYGAGSVELWDEGRYVNITVRQGTVVPLAEALEQGHFVLFLKGGRLQGSYAFTRTGKDWVVVRKRERQGEWPSSYERAGRTIKVTNPSKELDEGFPKAELVAYYARVAPWMLPHVKGHPLSLFRFPDGVGGKRFFQKNVPAYFPGWFRRACVGSGAQKKCYAVADDEASIIYLGNQVVEPHMMIAPVGGEPDRMVFDLDPSEEDLSVLRSVARGLRRFLSSIGFVPFIMTSGGKGYHVTVPLVPSSSQEEVKAFASKVAEVLERGELPVTTAMRKDRREGKVLLDVQRNSSSQTAIAPYGARARPRLPVACPFPWDELPNVAPATFTIRNVPARDAWAEFSASAVSLADVSRRLKE